MVDLARLFKGWDEPALRRMAEWVVEHELWAQRRPSVIAELEAHRRAGARLILASATYQQVIEIFAERCGAQAIGTPLEIAGGLATGGIDGRLNAGVEKAERLRVAIAPERPSIAYGDSASDIPMLELSAAAVWWSSRMRNCARSPADGDGASCSPRSGEAVASYRPISGPGSDRYPRCRRSRRGPSPYRAPAAASR